MIPFSVSISKKISEDFQRNEQCLMDADKIASVSLVVAKCQAWWWICDTSQCTLQQPHMETLWVDGDLTETEHLRTPIHSKVKPDFKSSPDLQGKALIYIAVWLLMFHLLKAHSVAVLCRL